VEWVANMFLAATIAAKKLLCETVSAVILRRGQECICRAFRAVISLKSFASLVP